MEYWHLLPFDALRDSTGALLLETRTVSYCTGIDSPICLRTVKDPQPSRHAFLGVGDVVYRNQGHVSSKIDKPTAVKQRLLRGFSDALGHLCTTCRRLARRSSNCAKFSEVMQSCYLAQTQPRPPSNLSLCRISKSFILPRMGLRIPNFQSGRGLCWRRRELARRRLIAGPRNHTPPF